MERKPEPESLPVEPFPGAEPSSEPEALPLEADPLPRVTTGLLVALMLLPWLWVYLGLIFFADYRITIIIYEILGCALPTILLSGSRIPILPLRCNGPRLFAVSFILAILILLVYFGSDNFGMNWEVFHRRAKLTHLVVSGGFWLFAGIIAMVNPILEESFWRGLVYRAWRHRLGPLKARWITSFFFGAWHWMVLREFCHPVWAVVLTLLVMIGGFTFCMLFERSRTLGPSILFHCIGADLPMIFVVYDCVTNH